MVEQITAAGLAEMIDDDESFVLVDTRPKETFDAWHLPGANNVPYDPKSGVTQEHLQEIADLVDTEPLVIICGKGLSSTQFAFELEDNGYAGVTVVAGGMEAWSKHYDVVPIETTTPDLVVRQLQRRAKGCIGYLIGSKSAKRAIIVDATRQIDQFKLTAQDAGMNIERVLDTHVHADHISGGRALATDVGADYLLSAGAAERGVEYEFEPIADGNVIELGEFEIEALHTPGHTSDMMNFLVADELLLTGDTLFVDSVGRTELQFGDGDAARGAEMLYSSLHEVVLELPEDVMILPGHVTVTRDGRYEGGSPGKPISARIGDLLERLDILQMDADTFVARLVENAPEKPANYERIISINTGIDTIDDEGVATELELGPNNCAA